MADVVDRAGKYEEKQRQSNIDAQLKKGQETETPRELAGVRYCLDCDEEIDARRVAFKPDVVRCVECQSFKEKWGR